MAMTMLSLTACAPSSPEPAAGEVHYDLSADVDLQGWAATDTLFYPITISAVRDVRTPLVAQHAYRSACCIRTDASCRLTHIPMQLVLQQVDEQGAVLRNVLRTEIAAPVRDDRGYMLGESWGSLYQYECDLPDLTLRFDSVGTYRLLLNPAIGSQAVIEGVASIGVSLIY